MKKRARKRKRQQPEHFHIVFRSVPFAGSFVLLDLLRTLCGEGGAVQGLYIILPLRLLALKVLLLPLLFFFWFLAFLISVRRKLSIIHSIKHHPTLLMGPIGRRRQSALRNVTHNVFFLFVLFKTTFPPSKSIYGRRKDNLSTPDDPSNPPPTHPQWGDPICPCTSPPSMVLKMTWYW